MIEWKEYTTASKTELKIDTDYLVWGGDGEGYNEHVEVKEFRDDVRELAEEYADICLGPDEREAMGFDDDDSSMQQCQTCGRELDIAKNAYTYCSKCNRYFCISMFTRCFTHHAKLYGCVQTCACNILDPQWLVNLCSTAEEKE